MVFGQNRRTAFAQQRCWANRALETSQNLPWANGVRPATVLGEQGSLNLPKAALETSQKLPQPPKSFQNLTKPAFETPHKLAQPPKSFQKPPKAFQTSQKLSKSNNFPESCARPVRVTALKKGLRLFLRTDRNPGLDLSSIGRKSHFLAPLFHRSEEETCPIE